MKTLELVFFDAGGGHRSAANALCEVVKRRDDLDWEMRMMNLQELLDEMDVFRKVTGVRLQDLYNMMLRRGWTLGSPALMKGMHGVIRVLHSTQVKMLAEYWKDRKPDLLISLIPNFNRALFEAAQKIMPSVPMVTILTDMADYPPHFWIERQNQYFICGTEHAKQQALALGHSPDRVFLTSGMILNPRFYEVPEVDRKKERAALGLDPSLPTAMIMFGGEGSRAMLPMARDLDASGLDLQIIAICGKNHKLEAAMREMPHRVPMHVVGFTKEVPKFMQLSDFFIGKPGPGSISEAVAMGLPVIIERNNWTLPQERYNADWVQEQGVGIAVRHFKNEIVEATTQMLDPVQRFEFLKRVTKQKNRAVFEIPEILSKILDTRLQPR
jgi:UDP-N-acetylglucosamine:LPS N-acetylglucosamine transferase